MCPGRQAAAGRTPALDGSGGGCDRRRAGRVRVRYGCDRPCQPGQGGGSGWGHGPGTTSYRRVPAVATSRRRSAVIPVAAARRLGRRCRRDHDVTVVTIPRREIRPLALRTARMQVVLPSSPPYLPELELNRIVVRTYGTEVPALKVSPGVLRLITQAAVLAVLAGTVGVRRAGGWSASLAALAVGCCRTHWPRQRESTGRPIWCR